jgi:hypothetical protein
LPSPPSSSEEEKSAVFWLIGEPAVALGPAGRGELNGKIRISATNGSAIASS